MTRRFDFQHVLSMQSPRSVQRIVATMFVCAPIGSAERETLESVPGSLRVSTRITRSNEGSIPSLSGTSP
jgi:hypothetical protein